MPLRVEINLAKMWRVYFSYACGFTAVFCFQNMYEIFPVDIAIIPTVTHFNPLCHKASLIFFILSLNYANSNHRKLLN